MSFGQKNNAWARQPAPQSQQINPNLFTNQLPLGAQFTGQVPGMNLGPGINALVNQAAFSNNLNMLAQARQMMPQNVQQGQPRTATPPGPGKQPNQRSFVGQITKLMDTYGFIDEDVFFQTSVIRGPLPRVGDRVMVEATFNPSMPFKWNAYRISIINEQQPQVHQGAPPREPHVNRWGSTDRSGREDHRPADRRAPSGRRSPPPRRERSPVRRSPAVRRPSPRKSSPPRRSEAPKRERDRSPRPSREPRQRSPAKTREAADSPPRRRQRIIPRYQCYVPKPIVEKSGTCTYLHKRYSSLYIPSDFVRADFNWPQSFNLEEPITFSPNGVDFHTLSKDIDYPLAEGETFPEENPSDADSRFIVKVLLLSHPGAAAIRQKVTGLMADGSIDEAQDVQHWSKVVQLVVGIRGKSEVMGIGGSYSPSLDGPNPEDPQTLINTAIRTTKASTGIDLSKCPVWYKLAQIRYHRTERARRDTVVLMLPDVSGTPGLQPDAETYRQLTEVTLKAQLDSKIAAVDAETFTPSPELLEKITPKVEEQKDVSMEDLSANVETSDVVKEEPNNDQASKENDQAQDKEMESEEIQVVEEKISDERKPKHWSELSVKGMKVAELRDELEIRGLDCKGVKNALALRLQEALDTEKAAEEKNGVPAKEEELVMTDEVAGGEELALADEVNEIVKEQKMDTAPAPAKEEEATKEKKEEPAAKIEEHPEYKKELEAFEKQKKERKQFLERHYQYPKEPCVFIYPSKTAKGGKFNCKLNSLQTLLDYRIDDNKESSFEVFLFCEAIKEAVDRSNAFNVFHVLNSILDKDEEKKRRDEALTKPEEEKKESQENGEEKKEEVEEKKEEKKEDPRNNFRAVVGDIASFQSFSHFDTNVCGYLLDRDLEEIIYTVGLNLSRSTVQKLIKRVASKDRFNYRNVVDKWIDKDNNVKYAPEFWSEAPTRPDLLSEYEEKPEKSFSTSSSTGTPDVTEGGVVYYKGTVLNLVHTLEQQKKVEAERTDALLKIDQLDQQLKTVKDQRDRYDKKRKHLEDDLEKYKKKLHDAEKCLKNTHDDTVLMKSSLVDARKLSERLISIVDKALPRKEKKEKEDKEKKEKSDGTSEASSPVKSVASEAKSTEKNETSKEDVQSELNDSQQLSQATVSDAGEATPITEATPTTETTA